MNGGQSQILAPEQVECSKGSRGFKELLIVDSVVSQQAKKEQRDKYLRWMGGLQESISIQFMLTNNAMLTLFSNK
jgi:hypothetical protein